MKSKRLLFLIAGVLTIANLYAQKPVSPQWTGELRKSNPVKMDCNDAGRVGFGNFTGISNDRDASTVDLSGDPNTTTRGGIGYAFYKCPPTITGPDLASILQDTCLITDPTPTNGLWVAVAPDNSGDITFLNNGAIQDFFSAGGPIQIWFAPITYDKLDTVALPGGTLSFRPTFEGTPVGSCVDVSVDQAFSVVYLNQIIATDRNENAGGNGCRGSFTALGGLPEFAPTTDYRITITKRGATAVRGTLLNNGPIRHDTEVLFSVPEPGVYDIMISDGKSCDGTFSMNMNGCMPVEFIADRLNALPGQRICVDVQVKNFIDVGSAQFTISFDPTVLRFDTVENLNLRDLTPDAFNSSQNGGIAMSWFTPFSACVSMLSVQ